MKLLIIEDDVVFSQTLKRRLDKHQFCCEICNDYDKVLLHAMQSKPNFIILDMNLDSGTGLDLIRPLRASLPKTRIILLTGFASIATAVKAIQMGADDYLTKPVDTKTLIHALTGEQGHDGIEDFQPMSPDRLEWEHIHQVLNANDGNVSATARQLGMHRRTLQRKLQKKPALN